MVNIQDCGCPCEDNGKKKQIEERALSSINKIYTTEGATYFPNGTGMVTLPLPTAEQIQQIGENSKRLTIDEETLRQLKISDAENVEAIAQAQRDISAHAEEIGDIKATDAQQNTKIKTAEGEIDALKTLTDSITKSLITDVEVRDGAGSGTFLVELTEEDGTKRASDTYQYGQVGSFELIQGTEAGYVRGRLTLTNGVVKESNDYQILQLVESDVYVTAITLTPDYTAGKLGGEIGYSNGNKAQIDPVLVPTAPGVTSNIDALLKRMTSAETVDKEQTAKIANLETRVKAIEDTPGVGQFAAGKLGTIKGGTADGSVQAQEDGTGTVVGWSGKASAASVTALQDATKVAVENFAITESADKVTITTTAIDGATSKSEDIPAVTDTMAGIVTPELKKKWDSTSGNSKTWTIYDGSITDIITIPSEIFIISEDFIIEFINGVNVTSSTDGTTESYKVFIPKDSYAHVGDFERVEFTIAKIDNFKLRLIYLRGAEREAQVLYNNKSIQHSTNKSNLPLTTDGQFYRLWVQR